MVTSSEMLPKWPREAPLYLWDSPKLGAIKATPADDRMPASSHIHCLFTAWWSEDGRVALSPRAPACHSGPSWGSHFYAAAHVFCRWRNSWLCPGLSQPLGTHTAALPAKGMGLLQRRGLQTLSAWK